MAIDVWRSLAKDGAKRAEVRRICSEPLIDYSGASWAEWETLGIVAEECARLIPNPAHSGRGSGGES